MSAAAIAAVQRRVSGIPHTAESKRTHTRLAHTMSYHARRMFVSTQRKGWGMGKHGVVVRLEDWRARRSGRALRGRHSELVAAGVGFEGAGSQSLKLELTQLRDGAPGLPVAEVALKDAKSLSSGDLRPVVLEDVVIGHGPYYRHAHMCADIDSSYAEGTIPKMATIGERVRARRKELGLNQVELAKAIGVYQSTVSDIENNKAFEAKTLIALSKVLLMSPQLIMTGEPDAFEMSAVEAKMISAFRQASPPAPKPAPAATPTKEENITARQISGLSNKAARKRRAG